MPSAVAEAGGAAADDAGAGVPCEGLGDPDFCLEHADSPRLRMATETPRISTGRVARDVNERWDMILLDGTWSMGSAGRGGLAIRTITIKIPDGRSIGWCVPSGHAPPDDVRRLDGSYRPDPFTDEVSFE